MSEFETQNVDVTTKAIEYIAKRPLLFLNDKPTSTTKGLEGQFAFEIPRELLYLCTGKAGSSYIWELISSKISKEEISEAVKEYLKENQIVEVDQSFDPESENAQSGKAVAGALADKADKSYVDTIVDSVNSALDEIHAYAESIISGGEEV